MTLSIRKVPFGSPDPHRRARSRSHQPSSPPPNHRPPQRPQPALSIRPITTKRLNRNRRPTLTTPPHLHRPRHPQHRLSQTELTQPATYPCRSQSTETAGPISRIQRNDPGGFEQYPQIRQSRSRDDHRRIRLTQGLGAGRWRRGKSNGDRGVQSQGRWVEVAARVGLSTEIEVMMISSRN